MTAPPPEQMASPLASPLIDLIARAKAGRDVAVLVDAIPYARFLGLGAALVEPDEIIVTMQPGPHLIGNPALPALHGGTLGALLESAAIFEILWRAETVMVLPKTITITIDYLRTAGSHATHARAFITRQGRRVSNVRLEAWQQDRAKPVASAQAIFLMT